MDGWTADQVLRLQRQIRDIEDLAAADPELAEAYEALLDERREALARLLRAADQGEDASEISETWRRPARWFKHAVELVIMAAVAGCGSRKAATFSGSAFGTYKHGAVRHSAKEWSYYDYRTGAKHHTNSVEGFWRHFKASVRGTHIHISQKHMVKYLSEFSYRANNVARQNAMFDHLIANL